MAKPDDHRDLLDRATAALERIDATVARQAESFDRQAESFDRQAESFDRLVSRLEADRVESRAHHERMMRRMDRSEAILVEAIGDIDLSLQRNTDRLEQMGAAIRDIRDTVQANTQAVLSVLDRLGPATG